MNKLSKNRKNKKKKAQLEMIGLIIIVIIVITAILIFTIQKVSTPPKNIQKRYMNKEIATNFLISITKTNVNECYNLSLAELITDCAKTHLPYIDCHGLISCDAATNTISNILDRTLIDWGISFNLSVEGTPISFVNLGCTSRAKEKVQGFEILPLYPGQAEMILDICTK